MIPEPRPMGHADETYYEEQSSIRRAAARVERIEQAQAQAEKDAQPASDDPFSRTDR